MKKLLYFLFLVAAATGCKEVYEPNIISPLTGYLVVEGFINSGNGISTFTLTRTTKLVDDVSVLYEHNAQVQIESNANNVYALNEGLNGTYTSAILNLNPSSDYRIRIRTQDGKEYLSDFTATKHTPVIDSINWQKDQTGLGIYVNTHDDQKNTKYYRWNYTETWEFHSSYLSYLDYERDPVTNEVTGVMGRSNTNTESLYRCWKTQHSRQIIIGSSEKLSTDRIYLPVRHIEENAEELSVLYYIELSQYAISHEAYLFYQKMKKNTEQLGTIFDAQPSEISGNIHCVSNPGEIAIGFVEVSEEQVKKYFLSNEEIRPWVTSYSCSKITIYNHPDSIKPFADSYIPLNGVTFRGLAIVTFDAASPICVDCSLRGSNVKPSFWP
ncbi:DUF4249 domain-containing protein [soil metagenome]